MTGLDIFCWVMVLGLAINVAPTMRRLDRLADRDPLVMCASCREQRRILLYRASIWRGYGSLGMAALVVFEASGWFIPAPVVGWLRRVAGSDPRPPCAGSTCAAHARYR